MCEIGNYVLIASMLRKERDRQTEREREREKGAKGEGTTKMDVSSAII